MKWIALAIWIAAFAVLTQAQDGAVRELELTLSDGQKTIVLLPSSGTSKLPVLVALHGRGEARKGPARGYRGWARDYSLGNAYRALLRGRLVARDFGGLATDAMLRDANRALAAAPFRGLVVVTPFTPDLIDEPFGSERIHAYGEFLGRSLLPQVCAQVPRADCGHVGIDGVSLGGMLSLEIGLDAPGTWDSVGGIQPAIRGRTQALADLARRKAGGRPIRLMTSDDDPFRGVTRELAAALDARSVPRELIVTPGPHGYAFNRGPGSIELLRFHERALSP